MRAYFIRRFLLIIPTFLGITLNQFYNHAYRSRGTDRAGDSDKFAWAGNWAKVGGETQIFVSSTLTNDAIEQMRKDYGFDKPVLVRYAQWLWNILRLDLGTSYIYGDPVWNIIQSRLPVSLYFGFIGFFMTYLVCIPLGVMKAIKHKQLFDTITSIFVFVGYATPGFALGIVLLVLLGGGSFLGCVSAGGLCL